jgi:hypothetical protein
MVCCLTTSNGDLEIKDNHLLVDEGIHRWKSKNFRYWTICTRLVFHKLKSSLKILHPGPK